MALLYGCTFPFQKGDRKSLWEKPFYFGFFKKIIIIYYACSAECTSKKIQEATGRSGTPGAEQSVFT